MLTTAIDRESETTRTTPAPRAAQTIAETGISVDQLHQLFLKSLYTGEVTGVQIADRMCLLFSVLEPLVDAARAERLIEVR